jgi:hypothetical protein
MMFADWQVRRDVERRAAKARGRELKKRRKQKPVAPPEPEPVPYVAMRHLKVRAHGEGDGDNGAALADITIGARVLVFERSTLENGSAHARVALDDGDLPKPPLGWVPLSSPSLPMPSLLPLAPLGGLPATWEASKFLENVASDDDRRREEAWLMTLDAFQFKVLRLKGTEDAHAGPLLEHFAPCGVYACAACGARLYDAVHKVPWLLALSRLERPPFHLSRCHAGRG